ncbi:hypothetical protein TNCV_2364551 [Trichonephila clavipes]|nr:hypothetical protein TNCV_2364551 [Trichonephila clavipes]
MITNFFIPELNNHDVQELWFQQDGATCHTARATIDLLKDTFGDRLISRFGPVNWPCNVTSRKQQQHLVSVSLSVSCPHVQFPIQRNPCLTPPRNLATRPEDERRDALNLHGSGNQRNLLSQNSGL